MTLLRDRPHELEFAVTAPHHGYVVVTDSFYPGWRAWLDDRPVPIRRANGVHRAVAMPAGRHRLRFAYHPSAPRLGFFLSLLTLAGLGAVLAATRSGATRPSRS